MSSFNWFSIFFQRKHPDRTPAILFPGLVTEAQYRAFEPDRRMQAVMVAGDSGGEQHFEFIKWCILNDPDQGVRLSAVKRLPNFKNRSELTQFLKELDSLENKSTLEPYLSIACSKLGLITDAEFQTRLKDGQL